MRTVILAVWAALGLLVLPFYGTARAEPVNCRSIADSLERLRCYDAQADQQSSGGPQQPAGAAQPPAPPSATRSAPPPEDPLIAKAKAAVKRQLRDPDSGRFQNIKLKTVAGKKGLCGEVNAKNAMGGMTGFVPFAYDGQYAYILSFNAGTGNPTSLGADIWGVTVGSRLEAHDKWCK
jgi:hypothetical protein